MACGETHKYLALGDGRVDGFGRPACRDRETCITATPSDTDISPALMCAVEVTDDYARGRVMKSACSRLHGRGVVEGGGSAVLLPTCMFVCVWCVHVRCVSPVSPQTH